MDNIQGLGSAASPSVSAQYRQLLKALAEIRAGAAAKAQTTLNYELDMDERGVLRSSTPGRSQIDVTNQEQTNVTRLRAEAQARGEDVVSVDISYGAALVDGKLSLRSGKTTVVSIPREQRDAASEVYQANRDAAHSVRPFNLDDPASLMALSEGMGTPESSGASEPPSPSGDYRLLMP